MKTSKSQLLAAVLASLPAAVLSQVQGTPFGFAKDVTGGGSAAPAAPADIEELAAWLSDDTERVILIDKEFNFIGSEGSTTGQVCRSTERCGADDGGQDTIKDTCDDNEESVEGTWDNAGADGGLDVGSNKSLVGVGDQGVIRGKGLSIGGGASNIIIQNIHFTEINPQYVWGGDALSLDGTTDVWIDHNKFSLAGRQFLVSGFNPSGRVTVSNNEFDGVTSWSTQCNGKHNWGVMLVGSEDEYTFANNLVHDMSSRAPKLGQTVTEGTNEHFFHGYNNVFRDISGHAFDIDTNTNILLEANVFEGVNEPVTGDSAGRGGHIFIVDSGSEGTCEEYIGRACLANSASSSGELPALGDTEALSASQERVDYIGAPVAASEVASLVEAGAGIGKI